MTTTNELRQQINDRLIELNQSLTSLNKEWSGIGQREMLSGTGNQLKKEIASTTGQIVSLEWVLANIDFTEPDTI